MSVNVSRLSPPEMHQNPAFSQAVVVEGNARTIYVGGQNAVSPDGQIVGVGDLAAQTEQVLKNLRTVLRSAGADLHDVVRWTLYIVEGQDIMPGFAIYQKFWGDAPPPAVSRIRVAGLANPNFLIELDAIAVVGATPTAG